MNTCRSGALRHFFLLGLSGLPLRAMSSQDKRMDRNKSNRSESQSESDRRAAERRRESRRAHKRIPIVEDQTDRRQDERREDGDG